MRIPDEKQLFDIGDKVLTSSGEYGVVRSVMSTSHYYEARPIASFIKYTYVVAVGEEKLYLSSDEISSI